MEQQNVVFLSKFSEHLNKQTKNLKKSNQKNQQLTEREDDNKVSKKKLIQNEKQFFIYIY